MDNKKFTITAIVPFYNEEMTLEKSINELAKIKIVDEIFLVDDNSNDKSTEVATRLEKKIKKISYFRLPLNSGKGGAVIFPINKVTTSHVVIHDADLEYNPLDINQLFYQINGTDSLIIGDRFAKNNNNIVQMNLILKIIERFSTILFNILYKTSLNDIGTGYKLIPTKFLKDTNFVEKGFFFDIEVLAKFVMTGGQILQTPIGYNGRDKDGGKKNNKITMIKFPLKVMLIRFS